jgi:hypothetical protein
MYEASENTARLGKWQRRNRYIFLQLLQKTATATKNKANRLGLTCS